jgi:isoleucyl-tRNA synthetase
VRQPIASVTTPKISSEYQDIVLEELNAKNLVVGDEVTIDNELTPQLKREGLMREVVRHVQAARKKADLQVDDRIKLQLHTDDSELNKAIDEHNDTIMHETLSSSLKTTKEKAEHQSEVSVEKAVLTIGIDKA